MQTRSCPGKTAWEHAAVNFSNPHKFKSVNTRVPTTGSAFLSPEVYLGNSRNMLKRQKYRKESQLTEKQAQTRQRT